MLCFSGACYHDKIKPSMTKVEGHESSAQHSIEMVELNSLVNVQLSLEHRRPSAAAAAAAATASGGSAYLLVTRYTLNDQLALVL